MCVSVGHHRHLPPRPQDRYSRSALEYYVPIPKDYWNFFIETYGGGPTVSLNAYLRMRTRQETTSEGAD